MNRVPIIAGNWKMHKTAAEAAAFIGEVKESMERMRGVEAVLCAPFTALPALAQAARGSRVAVGAQNMHWEEQGAYTGEVSAPMLADLGVTHVILGHSERRQYFAETDETVNRKLHTALRFGLTPIVCVGETLEQRDAGRTKEVCRTQVLRAFHGLKPEQAAAAVIAYEPIWAIGTGRASTAEDANEVIGYIRETVAGEFGASAAEALRILYGGSVNPGNIAAFMAAREIDGALVGGASLDPASYVALVEGAQR